jgi:ABC-type lipoprotein release transport system permease subunit
VTKGDTVTLYKTTADGSRNKQRIAITGIYDSGDSDNNAMYIPSSTAQVLANLPDSIDKIEVKALTRPVRRRRIRMRSRKMSGKRGIAPRTLRPSPIRSKRLFPVP